MNLHKKYLQLIYSFFHLLRKSWIDNSIQRIKYNFSRIRGIKFNEIAFLIKLNRFKKNKM
jgi:hypothetical protein